MILDVGCGRETRGDVNIDVDRDIIDELCIHTFILADAHHLPFRNKMFSLVYCHHVLEHLKNPIQALEEMKRVAKKTLIYVPSEFNVDKQIGHIFTWNQSTLFNLLKMVFANVEVHYLGRRHFIHGKVKKHFPIFNTILSKLGFHTELQAICE